MVVLRESVASCTGGTPGMPRRSKMSVETDAKGSLASLGSLASRTLYVAGKALHMQSRPMRDPRQAHRAEKYMSHPRHEVPSDVTCMHMSHDRTGRGRPNSFIAPTPTGMRQPRHHRSHGHHMLRAEKKDCKCYRDSVTWDVVNVMGQNSVHTHPRHNPNIRTQWPSLRQVRKP